MVRSRHYDYIIQGANKQESANTSMYLANFLVDEGASVLLLASGKKNAEIIQSGGHDVLDLKNLRSPLRLSPEVLRRSEEIVTSYSRTVFQTRAALRSETAYMRMVKFCACLMFELSLSGEVARFLIGNRGADPYKFLAMETLRPHVEKVRWARPFGPTGKHIAWVEGVNDDWIRYPSQVAPSEAFGTPQSLQVACSPNSIYTARGSFGEELPKIRGMKSVLEKGFSRNAFECNLLDKARDGIGSKIEFRQQKKVIGKTPSRHHIVYPFQNPRESALTSIDARYRDQFALIRNIAFWLPTSLELLLKLHPRQRSYLSNSQLRCIDQMPNVNFCTSELSKGEVLDRCGGVVTVSSTLGFDALVLGKPVFVLGHPFYRACESVDYVQKISDLPVIIRRRLEEEKSVRIQYELCELLTKTLNPGHFFPTKEFRTAEQESLLGSFAKAVLHLT